MTSQWRAFRVAYDGRQYHGFQRQPDVPTVSDELLDAFADLDIPTVPEQYAAAGRTDAGVSALAQTISCPVPEWLTPAAINAHLPASVAVWAMADVPDGFHATHSATSRTYAYHLYLNVACDADQLIKAAERLTGTHDFHNLTPDSTGTERTVDIDITIDDPIAVLEFHSDGFPRQFVRRAVSLLRRVAANTTTVDFIDRVLTDTPLSGPEGIPPAAPEPLVLVDVTYPDISFEPAATTETIHKEFQDRCRDLRSTAAGFDRIAAGILDRS